MSIPFKFALGVRVRDRVSGMVGIICARTEFLNGCLRYSVQPAVEKDKPGVMPDSWYVDEGQLEQVDEGVNAAPVALTRTGGPVTRTPAAKAP